MRFISPECTFIGSLCFGQNGIQTAEKKGYEVLFFNLCGHLICCLAYMRTFSFQKQSENPGVGLCAVDTSRDGQSQWWSGGLSRSASLQSNERLSRGYHTFPMGISSCISHGEFCRLSSWKRPVIAFSSRQLVSQLRIPWELVLREEASNSVPAQFPKITQSQERVVCSNKILTFEFWEAT